MIEFSKYNYTYGELSQRGNDIIEKGLKAINKQKVLISILSLIDLTTLSGDDTEKRITDLCNKATSYENKVAGISNVAAVCVYPIFAKLVSSLLSSTEVKTACVAGAFPSGQSPLNIRILEVEDAVNNGADDIDMVISRGKLIEGNFNYVYNEVAAIKKACGKTHLKVILETGELGTVQNIRKASELSILGGADFIKTSTGKIQPAATIEAFIIMLDTIKEYFDKTGIMIGIKPAGGISEVDDAIIYYFLVSEILGEKWLNNQYFRIGASRLADNVYAEIIK
ncbi:MAG: deoxyribose-phosphate aldolase [Bacteroidetes bacterium]|nr:deoxyribose-phosphate aldolase [Bacteroidota bacterium]